MARLLGPPSAAGCTAQCSGPTIEQFAGAAQVLGGRETFGAFALKSMPANALYAGALGGEATDPKFVD